MAVGYPSSTELNKGGDGDGDGEVNKNAKMVQHNESLASQEAPSLATKPLDAGILRSHKVNATVVPLPNSTYPVNGTELFMNATIALNDRGVENSSKASSEELQKSGPIVKLPGSIIKIKAINNQPPSSSQGPLDAKTCDISIGQWVQDDSYPLYRPGTCSFVDEAFSCQRNLRPDSKYNRWRWAPRDCIVPRYNSLLF